MKQKIIKRKKRGKHEKHLHEFKRLTGTGKIKSSGSYNIKGAAITGNGLRQEIFQK